MEARVPKGVKGAKGRVGTGYFFLECILMEAFACTDTAKVPMNTSNCTEIHPKMPVNDKICSINGKILITITICECNL